MDHINKDKDILTGWLTVDPNAQTGLKHVADSLMPLKAYPTISS